MYSGQQNLLLRSGREYACLQKEGRGRFAAEVRIFVEDLSADWRKQERDCKDYDLISVIKDLSVHLLSIELSFGVFVEIDA